MGYAVICPHKNSGFFDGVVPDKQFLYCGIEILSRCDCAVLVEGWDKSAGSRDERNYCFMHNIPVYSCVDDVPHNSNNDWLVVEIL